MRGRLFARAFAWLAVAVVASCGALEPPQKGGQEEGEASACPDDLAFFEARVWRPVLSLKCVGCHTATGPARHTRLVLEPAGEEGYLETNLEVMRRAAQLELGDVPVLLLRPTGMHPEGHTGGALIGPQSEGYQSLEAFIARANGSASCEAQAEERACSEPLPGRRRLRRLTRAEYDNTIRDLFGIDSVWGRGFAPDVVVHGFDNNADALVVSPLLADQLRSAAEEIAAVALEPARSLVPCAPLDPIGEACARDVVRELGKRAFRRPLEAREIDRYLALHVAIAEEDGFDAGLEHVLRALLQSPNFLYRLELGELETGDRYRLTPWEIATELSYLLWGTMPDAELFAAAESGALSDPEEVATQARRLLSDPRSTPNVARFFEQWLGVDFFPAVVKDEATFPGFEAVKAPMREEVSRFVDHVRRRGSGAFPELLTASYSVVSPELGAFYGVETAEGLAQFSDGEHAGLLTLGAVLGTYSFSTHTSPIHRGKLVRERFLCQELAPPPANLSVEPVPFDPSLPTRAQFAAHASNEPCQSCHRLIDEIGFAFERFDAVGRYRATESGEPIDARGEIVGSQSTDSTFDGVAELGALLAESPEVQRCFALQWFRFARGVEGSDELTCAVDSLRDRFRESGSSIDDLLVELTQGPHFYVRRAEASPGTGLGPASPEDPEVADGGLQAPNPERDAGGEPPNDDLHVAVALDSEWSMGSCHTVTVTNTGSETTEWQVTLTLNGTLRDSWSSTARVDGSDVTFGGVEYNARLAPGESTTFGYCVDR